MVTEAILKMGLRCMGLANHNCRIQRCTSLNITLSIVFQTSPSNYDTHLQYNLRFITIIIDKHHCITIIVAILHQTITIPTSSPVYTKKSWSIGGRTPLRRLCSGRAEIFCSTSASVGDKDLSG